jgi:pimeloyl-ACP methyl ester carboxylesterase
MKTIALAALLAVGLFATAQAQPAAPVHYPAAVPKVAKTWTDHVWTARDGTKVHYVEQGKGVPVILIHGLTSSAVGNWFNSGVAQRIAKTNRVIALDMRGHGDTGPSPAGSKGTMIQDVIDFMDDQKIPKAHIGGYSMGGATTAGLLKVAPDRFITASVMGMGVRETAEWQGKTPRDPAPSAPPAAPTASSATLAAAGGLTLNNAGVPRGAPMGAPEANPDVDLTRIRFPVLSLNGGDDTPLAKTHRMWRELQDYTYVVVPGRNHMQTSADPRFGEALATFISSHNPK